MMLQVLPPDFQYATEAPLINKAEIISFALLTLVFGLFLLVKFVKKDKSNFTNNFKFAVNYFFATIKKDLKIN